jgi:hypothetical protein
MEGSLRCISSNLVNVWRLCLIERTPCMYHLNFVDGYACRYKYNFPFLDDDVGVSVDDNRVGPLYKHVFPPHLAPQISFIGLSLKVNQIFSLINHVTCNYLFN